MAESPALPTSHSRPPEDTSKRDDKVPWKATDPHLDLDLDLSAICTSLITLARRAGEMITSAKPIGSDTATKKNSVDLVTETDRAVESMISTTLAASYPSFEFMGEETYKPGMKLTDAPTFVVDPIDGTTNFVHRYPYVSVSLGLAVRRVPVVGVVFNPFTGSLYYGVKGEGSWVVEHGAPGVGRFGGEGGVEPKRQRLPLSSSGSSSNSSTGRAGVEPLSGLSEALLVVEWGSDRSGPNWETKIKTWDRLGRAKEDGGAMVHSARCFGSAALNLCAVASGSVDLYWEGGCWAWDVCAGWVILSEAGGVVVDGNPGDWDVPIPVDHRKYLAVRAVAEDEEENARGQRKLVEEFWSFVMGRMEYEH